MKPLNSIGGNVMAWLVEKEPKHDLYLCPECSDMVTEDAFNSKHGVCYKCWFGGDK